MIREGLVRKKEKGVMKRRVVVTGLGMVTPLGTGVQKNWEAICSGKSGIKPIEKFDASSFSCQIAGEVTDFQSEDFLDKQQVRRFDIFVHYAIAAARMAMEESGLKIDHNNRHRIGWKNPSRISGLYLIASLCRPQTLHPSWGPAREPAEMEDLLSDPG